MPAATILNQPIGDNMKRLALASMIAITMGHGTITYAQDSLVGTYKGNFTVPSNIGDIQIGVQLIIASVEDGVVKGTLTQYGFGSGGACAGNYPMEGKYDGNKLVMRATAKGGRAGDCGFGFDVVQEGNKFVGKTGSGRPIQLSK